MHTLIIGRSFSGKSALAKQLGSSLRERDVEVLAFNPTSESGYTRRDDFGCAAAEFETHNADEFAEELKRRAIDDPKTRFVIIDEAHEFFTREKNGHLWIGTRGRHYGINVIAITQHGAAINPTFRGQCSRVYLFACNRLVAKFMAEEYDNDALLEATRLAPGSYICINNRNYTIVRGKVF